MEQRMPQGVFFPRGTIQTEQDKEKYRNMLATQNAYLSATRVVYIKGLSKRALTDALIQTSTETISLHRALLNTGLLDSIVPTNQSSSDGRYGLITDADRVNKLRHYIDTTVHKFFEDGIIPANEDYRYNHQWCPQRSDAPKVGPTSITYAHAILQTVPNPPTTQSKRRNWNTRQLPSQITYTNEEAFPPLPEPSQPKKNKTHANTPKHTTDIISVGSVSQPTLSVDIDRLQEIVLQHVEQKIQTQIRQAIEQANQQHTTNFESVQTDINSMRQDIAKLTNTLATLCAGLQMDVKPAYQTPKSGPGQGAAPL